MEGINSRLDGLQAAILSAKLPHIMEWTKKRIQNASLYDKYLSKIKNIILPKTREGTEHSFHLYVIRAKSRDALRDYLKQKGVETLVHYPRPLPILPAYQYLGYQPSDFPVAVMLQQEILSLPMYPELTEEMIRYVAESICSFYTDGNI